MRKLNRNAYTEDGTPKYLRIYDAGEGQLDRFTVVFSRLNTGQCAYLAVTEYGSFYHGSHSEAIDRPSYGHLGKKITFAALPAQAQRTVLNDYHDFWGVWTPQG